MSAVSLRAGEDDLGTFYTKRGNKVVVTSDRVLWLDKNGNVSQILVPHIARVAVENKGLVRKEYLIHVVRSNETWETTTFDQEYDRDAMKNAIQQAMMEG